MVFITKHPSLIYISHPTLESRGLLLKRGDEQIFPIWEARILFRDKDKKEVEAVVK